ncbi:hypothetical protein GGI20_001057 [Coemansia sp. BCRC 34301]|nr:hypothetical protein GGI20_001057 [Coemansia sp. BCRC 34301]
MRGPVGNVVAHEETLVDAEMADDDELIVLFKKLEIASFNPFVRRAEEKYRKIIAEKLLEVMNKHAESARTRLGAVVPASEVAIPAPAQEASAPRVQRRAAADAMKKSRDILAKRSK